MSNFMFHDSDHPLFQTTDTFQQLITDLNHFGDIVDSDMKYLDSAIGPETSGNLGKVRGLTDFTANTLVDALNELDSDLHGAGGGSGADLDTEAKVIVDAINEIEAVFDANAGKITTDSALAVITVGDETHTVTGELSFDVQNNITLDADGGVIVHKDGGVTRFNRTMGTSNIDSVTGDYTISTDGQLTLQVADSASGITFKRGENTRYEYTFGPDNKLEITGGYHIDVSGDMTIDTYNGNLYFYRDSDQVITWDLDSAITHMDVVRTLRISTQTGGITIDADSDIRLCTHTGHIHFQADSVAHSTEYATFTNDNGNVIFYTGLYSAGREIYRTDSADINFTRAIGLPTSGDATPHTTAKTVHGALAEVNARVPNVYDRNGTLLNA